MGTLLGSHWVRNSAVLVRFIFTSTAACPLTIINIQSLKMQHCSMWFCIFGWMVVLLISSPHLNMISFLFWCHLHWCQQEWQTTRAGLWRSMGLSKAGRGVRETLAWLRSTPSCTALRSRHDHSLPQIHHPEKGSDENTSSRNRWEERHGNTREAGARQTVTLFLKCTVWCATRKRKPTAIHSVIFKWQQQQHSFGKWPSLPRT